VCARDVLLLSYEQNGDVSECWGLFEENRRQTESYGVTEVQTELFLCDTFKSLRSKRYDLTADESHDINGVVLIKRNCFRVQSGY